MDQAKTGNTTTYRELAQRLRLVPPHTIHRVTEALERLTEEDVAAGCPMLAALCVSKIEPGVSARGFFLVAKALGVYSGEPSGAEAGELQRALSFMEPCARISNAKSKRGRRP